MYYTIGEVAEMLGENTSLIRFWSTTFSDFIKPVRNKKGNRLLPHRMLPLTKSFIILSRIAV